MRAIGAVLWLGVLGFCVFNWWQIRELRAQLNAQRATVHVSERSPGLLLKLERAVQHGERARDLLEKGRQKEARQELEQAMEEFTAAAEDTDQAGRDRLRRIEDSLARMREQTQGLLRRVAPGEKHGEGG
jgi:DNA anti-recombination protein RmuC